MILVEKSLSCEFLIVMRTMESGFVVPENLTLSDL